MVKKIHLKKIVSTAIKMSQNRRLMDPLVKALRRRKNKKLGLKTTTQLVSRFETRRKMESYLVPCLASVLDLVSGEDMATSHTIPTTHYCKYSTWAREKFSVQAKLFELRAKLRAIVTLVAETSKRLHKDFGTKALSFTQDGKLFHPTPHNRGA